ncbi:MAG: hypothetical protein KDK39_00310 [Leptospiraceae bacterium]|nr:hypothetical protein [Leptospiraceae bacterium]
MYPLKDRKIKLCYQMRTTELDPVIFAHLGCFLEIHESYLLFAPLRSILAELLNNAFKANAKHSFFQLKNLDPLAQGPAATALFVQALHDAPQQIKAASEQFPGKVWVEFESKAGTLFIRIKNTSKALKAERATIRKALRNTRSSVPEELEQKEGGGLGLRMSAYVLRNLGLGPECLQFKFRTDRTIFELRLPPVFHSADLQNTSMQQQLHSTMPWLPTRAAFDPDWYDPTAALLNQASARHNRHCQTPDQLKPGPAGEHSSEYPLKSFGMFDLKNGLDPQSESWLQELTDETDIEHCRLAIELQRVSNRLVHALSPQVYAQLPFRDGRQQTLGNLEYLGAGAAFGIQTLLKTWCDKKIATALFASWFEVDAKSHLRYIARIVWLMELIFTSNSRRSLHWQTYLDYLAAEDLISSQTKEKALALANQLDIN